MNQIFFSPFPVLSTSRLTLRQLTFEDENEIFAIRSNEEIAKYIGRSLYTNQIEARNFINKINSAVDKNESVYWVIAFKDDPKIIGTICLWNFSDDKFTAEVGFELLPDYQGKGIMSEALESVLNYGFNTIKLKSIEGEVDPYNEKSINLMKRYGFKLIESIHETDSEDVKNKKTIVYELVNPEI